MTLRRYLIAVVALFAAFAGAPARGQTDNGPTLSQVMKRGFVSCGVTLAPGFAEVDDAGNWRGFDVDFCRALASAIFDDPTKAQFTELPNKERVNALLLGWVDILASAPSWTISREAGQRVVYAGANFYDGQGFLVRRQRSFASAKDLNEVTICVQQGTPFELDLADYFHARGGKYEPRFFDDFENALTAYGASECDALTADVSTLSTARIRLSMPQDHAVLPDVLSQSPRGPVLRQGDDQWLEIARWTLFAMLDAEELGVSRANADKSLKSENPHVRRLLGVDGDRGGGLGLNRHWVYRIVKHVGNYADLFDNNFGPGSPFAMERRQNALWNKGGLMIAPPLR